MHNESSLSYLVYVEVTFKRVESLIHISRVSFGQLENNGLIQLTKVILISHLQNIISLHFTRNKSNKINT